MTLPTDAKARKNTPMARGLLDYFPDALAEVARLSQAGNDQHNPGESLHWDRSKSGDHADCILRHLVDRGTLDTDGMRHSAKVAWRALAQLQLELEEAQAQKDSTTVGVFIDDVLYPVVEGEGTLGGMRVVLDGTHIRPVEDDTFTVWNYDKGCAELRKLPPKNSEVYNGQEGWIHAYQDYEDSRS